MALWLVRADKFGEHAQQFLDQERIYLTWHLLNSDHGKLNSRDKVLRLLEKNYTSASLRRRINQVGQIWAFVHRMKPGDLAIVPNNGKRTLNVREITGD